MEKCDDDHVPTHMVDKETNSLSHVLVPGFQMEMFGRYNGRRSCVSHPKVL